MIVPAGHKTCTLFETGSSNLARNDEPLGSLELTSPFKVSRAWVPSSDGETGGKGVDSPVAGLVFRCKLVSSAFRIGGCGEYVLGRWKLLVLQRDCLLGSARSTQ
jgi:hypothetical protein